MKYLLDTNIFIEAYKRYYNDKIVYSFWEWLKNDDDIYTVKKVKDEIKDGYDNLFTLIKDIKTIDTSQNLSEVSEYVNKKYSKSEEINDFLGGADPLVIAGGVNNNGITIVTNEVLVNEDSQKIKIPNVCRGLKVKYQNGIFEILTSKQINLSNYS